MQLVKHQATFSSNFSQQNQPVLHLYEDSGYRLLYINGLNTYPTNANEELLQLYRSLRNYAFDTPSNGSKTLDSLFGDFYEGYKLIHNNNLDGPGYNKINQYVASIALKIEDDMRVSTA